MYTANVVDSVIFRAIGAPPNQRVTALRRAVRSVDADVWVPATVYRETATGTTARTGARTNPFLDPLVADGVVRVATPLPGNRDDRYETVGSDVERARHLTDAYLNDESKYPETNNWDDSSIVGLAVRLFEQHERIRVITHTADENLAEACVLIPPELGYYDVRSEYYHPPESAKQGFPVPSQLSWD